MMHDLVLITLRLLAKPLGMRMRDILSLVL
jgi:hypothetical protein